MFVHRGAEDKEFQPDAPRRFCSDRLCRAGNHSLQTQTCRRLGSEWLWQGTELGCDSSFYNPQVEGTFPRAEPAAGDGEITDALC